MLYKLDPKIELNPMDLVIWSELSIFFIIITIRRKINYTFLIKSWCILGNNLVGLYIFLFDLW